MRDSPLLKKAFLFLICFLTCATSVALVEDRNGQEIASERQLALEFRAYLKEQLGTYFIDDPDIPASYVKASAEALRIIDRINVTVAERDYDSLKAIFPSDSIGSLPPEEWKITKVGFLRPSLNVSFKFYRLADGAELYQFHLHSETGISSPITLYLIGRSGAFVIDYLGNPIMCSTNETDPVIVKNELASFQRTLALERRSVQQPDVVPWKSRYRHYVFEYTPQRVFSEHPLINFATLRGECNGENTMNTMMENTAVTFSDEDDSTIFTFDVNGKVVRIYPLP